MKKIIILLIIIITALYFIYPNYFTKMIDLTKEKAGKFTTTNTNNTETNKPTSTVPIKKDEEIKHANKKIAITYNNSNIEYIEQEKDDNGFEPFTKDIVLDNDDYTIFISYLNNITEKQTPDTGGSLSTPAVKFEDNKATFLKKVNGQELYYYNLDSYYDYVVQKIGENYRIEMSVLNEKPDEYNYNKYLIIQIEYKTKNINKRKNLRPKIIEILKSLEITDILKQNS